MSHDPNAFKVAFAVTEVGPEVAAGDYFTALEFGTALRKLLRWEVVWLPKADWYNVGDANALIAMTDHYDLAQLGPRAASLVKICWMRNWFDRWVGKPHFGMWDIRLCSSVKASEHIKDRYGFTSSVLRIATNQSRFRPRAEDKLYDYVFTGSYWGAPRDIEKIDPAAIGLRFALFGKNWENHPQFQAYCKGFAPYHAMPKIYNQSKILVDDANSVTKGWGSVNSRVFDALASGILVITNSATGSAELFNNQLPVYQSPNSLREMLLYYLDDPQLYQKTLAPLRSEVLAHHTYDIRARELTKIIAAYLQTRPPLEVTDSSCVSLIENEQPGGSCRVSIIIPVFNQAPYTAKCLETIFKNTPGSYEIIVVDNGSTDDTPQLLDNYAGKIRVLRNTTNQGFAKACNFGARESRAPYLLFLNNDTEVLPGWLQPMLDMASKDNIAAVGSKLLFPDNTIQHAGVLIIEQKGKTTILPRHVFLNEDPSHPIVNIPMYFQAITAACMLVKKIDFEAVNGFDEEYWNGSEDVDLCFKFQKIGKKVAFEPKSVVVHHEGKSGKERKIAIPKNNIRLREKWAGIISPDIIDYGKNIVPGTSKIVSPINKEKITSRQIIEHALMWWCDYSGNRPLQLAEQALQSKKWNTAIEIIKNIFAIYKNSHLPELYTLLAKAYKLNGEIEKSKSTLTQGIKKYPQNKKIISEIEKYNGIHKDKISVYKQKHSGIEIIDIQNIDNAIIQEYGNIIVIMPCTDTTMGMKTVNILHSRSGIPCTTIIAHDTAKYGFIATANMVFRKICSKYAVYLAQDAFPCRNWLSMATQALERSGKGLLAFNDGKWMGNLASFGMVRTAWVNTIYNNALFFPGYTSHAADNELTTIARATNNYIYDPNISLIEVDYEKENKPFGNHIDRNIFTERAKLGFGNIIDPAKAKEIVKDYQIFI